MCWGVEGGVGKCWGRCGKMLGCEKVLGEEWKGC